MTKPKLTITQLDVKAQLGAWKKYSGNACCRQFNLTCKTVKYFHWIICTNFYFLPYFKELFNFNKLFFPRY